MAVICQLLSCLLPLCRRPLLPTIAWSLTPAFDIYERCMESNSSIYAITAFPFSFAL